VLRVSPSDKRAVLRGAATMDILESAVRKCGSAATTDILESAVRKCGTTAFPGDPARAPAGRVLRGGVVDGLAIQLSDGHQGTPRLPQ
jgi:hypothetical protein